MGHLTELSVFVVAVLATTLGAMVGLGGGVFMVPLFSAFLGVPIKTAIAASGLAVVVGSLGSSSVYLEHRMVNLRLALVLLIATALGAIGGALLVAAAPVNALRLLLGIVLYAMVVLLSVRRASVDPVATSEDRFGLTASFYDPAVGSDVRYTPQHVAPGTALSTIAGFFSGLLGVGGGVIQVPLMNTLMRVPVKAAAATSAYMVGVTVVGSVLLYYANELLIPQVAIPAALGSFFGAQLGSRLGRRVRGLWLRRLLVAILFYLATTLLLQALGVPVPGTR
ncbi:MAG: sulfite exporter TauE/SafE family protein [Thermomicrobium sp.]|nr:sulfite exporter TauE/SafE family protein [Thermomicrobium sp.]MDW8059703.1 sulfite exporter TauE/SafE family protein [Thermomicrobium sp.]